MSQSEKGAELLQLNNYYEHTIYIRNSVPSKFELFTLAVLTIYLYLEYNKNDTFLGNNLKILAVSLNFLIFARLIGRILWGVKKESIFIVKGLGLQSTTVYNSNFKCTKFIPWHSINDVVINEAIVMQKVIFYLAVLTKSDSSSGGESIIPLFINMQTVDKKKKILKLSLCITFDLLKNKLYCDIVAACRNGIP